MQERQNRWCTYSCPHPRGLPLHAHWARPRQPFSALLYGFCVRVCACADSISAAFCGNSRVDSARAGLRRVCPPSRPHGRAAPVALARKPLTAIIYTLSVALHDFSGAEGGCTYPRPPPWLTIVIPHYTFESARALLVARRRGQSIETPATLPIAFVTLPAVYFYRGVHPLTRLCDESLDDSRTFLSPPRVLLYY